LPSSLQCSVDNTVSCSISVTAADIRHAEDATRRPSWIQPPVAEGITLEICGSELITSESSLSSVRLLLSQLCFGNKINEEAVFRVLPESFSSFLSLHPSHDTTVTDDDNTAPVTNGLKTSTPKFFETMKVTPRFKNMFRQYSSASVGAQSVDSTMQSSVTSSGGVEDLGPLNPGAYRASILHNGGSEVRVSFAAKMGVHDRGQLFYILDQLLLLNRQKMEGRHCVCEIHFYLFICLFIYLFIYLFIFVFVYLFIYFCI
jgi:hypothetical protein